jgi:cbb3-type cytochrome oxidase cytochrome c subunit
VAFTAVVIDVVVIIVWGFIAAVTYTFDWGKETKVKKMRPFVIIEFKGRMVDDTHRSL